jgi:hypothetical protein
MHLWEFNDHYDLTIPRKDRPWLLSQHENDVFIMETLSNLPQAMKAKLKGAQCCHLYLQVTLADITNSAGTHLVDWVTNPRYAQPPHRQANRIYPNQGHLSSTIWNTFVHLLQLTFTKGMNNKLRHPLGNWYQGCISQSWNTVFSVAHHKIYSFETEPR